MKALNSVKFLLALGLVVASFSLSACKKEATEETTTETTAGEAVENAGEAAGQAVENAGEATGEAVDNAGEAMDNAVSEEKAAE